LIATLASLLMASIWGYDAFAGLRPLLQSTLVLAPPSTGSAADDEEQY